MTQILTGLRDFPSSLRGGAIAVGNFDGVHRGHARLIEQLVRRAKEVGGPAIVLTFDPPPVAILVPERLPTAPLTTIARRASLLNTLCVDALIAYPTDRALINLTPEEFFYQKIVNALGAKAMVEGPNFRFGKARAGDTDLLRQFCDSEDMKLTVVEAREDASGTMISSSRIRKLLENGDVSTANEMLTQNYEIEGIVAKGAQRGRDLGFPTANLESIPTMLPSRGVYAGRVKLGEERLVAAINIGPNPTFGEQQDKVEVHLLDWSGSIYGERIHCELLSKIRDVRKFSGVDELRKQLEQDVAECRDFAAS